MLLGREISVNGSAYIQALQYLSDLVTKCCIGGIPMALALASLLRDACLIGHFKCFPD